MDTNSTKEYAAQQQTVLSQLLDIASELESNPSPSTEIMQTPHDSFSIIKRMIQKYVRIFFVFLLSSVRFSFVGDFNFNIFSPASTKLRAFCTPTTRICTKCLRHVNGTFPMPQTCPARPHRSCGSSAPTICTQARTCNPYQHILHIHTCTASALIRQDGASTDAGGAGGGLCAGGQGGVRPERLSDSQAVV